MPTASNPWKWDIKYMTKPEAEYFRIRRDSGAISFFRTGVCLRCGGELIKGKLYCSKGCYMEQWEARAIAEKIVGSEAQLETKAGSIRQGRVTQVTWHTAKISGHEVKWPKGVILDGDKSDEIEWVQLVWLNSNAV